MMAAEGRWSLTLRFLWISRCLTTSSSSFFKRMIRVRIMRLSASSCVSPSLRCMAPPPRWRLRWVHARFSLGRKYSCLASSTWSMASFVWALFAKMSRMTSWRSMTVIFVNFSQFLCWAGESSLSKTKISH